MSRRRCSKPSCAQPAVSTLTYVYADSTAVVGPLATYAEPHCYDLCQMHSDRLTAPRGWEVVRITPDPDALKPSSDDLQALADAVREAAKPRFETPDAPTADGTDSDDAAGDATHGRRGHLRVVPEVAHTDFTPTATNRQDAQDSPGARDPRRSEGSEAGHDVTRAGHGDAAAERYDEAHPVFAPTPDAGDKPFDHEGLW
ncbi:MAG: DUF3499 domain-containing protein [Candidatus Nanopelagicales bacterium]|nr:DUF3499 domain-containing protein [Candidatus Nanopelagicales bacterium]